MLGVSSLRLSSRRSAAAALSRSSSVSSPALLSRCNNAATKALTSNFSSFSLSSSTPSSASTDISCGWRGQPINILPNQPKNIIATDRSFSSKSKGSAGEDTISGSSQHDTWVNFQRSIAVSGFETGQTVVEKNLGRKSRGGRLSRKKKEKEAELAAAMRGQDVTNLKGGEFPALRYSDEETERLLAEAYAAIPQRAGKRGTRNLKRQKRRWFIKRQYDKKKKYERMAEHERRMAKRHEISLAMHQIRENAGDVREKDQAYQQEVLKRWAKIMGYADSKSDLGSNEQKETMTS